MATSSETRAACALIVGALLSCAQAAAQEDDPRYRAAIEQAVAEFDAARFPEARALFLRAHDIQPNARTLRGVGLASFEMRDYVEAYRALTASLRETARPLTSEQRSAVEALIERTAAFLGFYRVQLAPAGATLSLDGAAPVQTEDGRLVLPIGEHELVARMEGHREARARVRVRGGEDEPLELELAPLEVPAPVVPVAAVSSTPPTTTAPDASVAHVMLVGGSMASATAIALGLGWWLTREEEMASCDHPPAGFACDNVGVIRSERDAAAALTLSAAAVGAGALVIGVVLLASAGEGAPPRSAACHPLGLGVACRF